MENTNISATEKKTSKRRIKKWPFIVGGVVLTVVVAIVLLLTLGKPKAEVSVLSAKVSESDIVTTVTGTGSLTSADAEDIKLPAGLEIDEVLVSEGEMINEGDAIATVNTASVLSLIDDIQSELKTLDTKINKAENETSAESVKTYVSGRVKEIYVSEGDNAAAAISKHGALVLLSIGGTMEVSVEADIAVGTDVTVLLTDGTEVNGSVISSANGVSVVTFSDAYGKADDDAAVKDSEGNTLGTGKIAISEPLEIIAPAGTVSEIYVDVNDKVSSGKALLKLKDIAGSADYEEHLRDRGELLDMLRTLSSLAADSTLRAPFSGIVGSLYIADGSAVSSSSATSSSSDSDSTFSAFSWMSAEVTEEPAVTLLAAEAEPVTVLNLDDMKFTAPKAGAVPVTLIENIPAYKAEIIWAPQDPIFLPETVYTAQFKLTANAGFTFPANIIPELKNENGEVIPAAVTDIIITDDGSVLSFKAVFAATEKLNIPSDVSDAISDFIADSNISGGSADNSAGGSLGNFGGSVNYAGYLPSYSSSYSSAVSSASDTDISGVTALTLAPIDTIRISISIDELDILSIERGQKATIEVDALEGEKFEGEITDIANNATSSGGTAKYTVNITLPRSEKMKNGMSATATIITSEDLGVMTIPTEAIQEQGSRVFVYTSVDSEGNFGGETEIETGVSDGTRTEILSGIAAGDTVYYESTNIDPMTQMFNMMMGGAQNMQQGGGEMPDFGGERPGSGERPSGGMR